MTEHTHSDLNPSEEFDNYETDHGEVYVSIPESVIDHEVRCLTIIAAGLVDAGNIATAREIYDVALHLLDKFHPARELINQRLTLIDPFGAPAVRGWEGQAEVEESDS